MAFFSRIIVKITHISPTAAKKNNPKNIGGLNGITITTNKAVIAIARNIQYFFKITS